MTIRAAENLTSACHIPLFRLRSRAILLREKRRSNSQHTLLHRYSRV
jgi:hypothetical protein